jgi:hypothetical protein
MGGHCFRCVHREDTGSCSFVKTAFPHPEAPCFLEPSRFESKKLGGKAVAPYWEEPDPAPKSAILKGAEGDESSCEGYAMVVRDGIKFMAKDGKAYSAGPGREYLGELKNMEPAKPTEQEMDEAIARLRKSLAKEYGYGEENIQPDVG